MINLDLSKVFHPRIWDLLPAFMPGLFFEMCILFGRPDLVHNTIAPAQLERYLELLIALILAFIIGNAFMLWVRVIQLGLAIIYRRSRNLWKRILEYLLRTRGSKPSRFSSSRFLHRAYQKAVFPDLRAARQAWQKAAVRLLQVRYGIRPPHPVHPNEWEAWLNVLGRINPERFRGILLLAATQATGWSALVGAYIAPALRVRPFLLFALFLIAYGIFREWGLTKLWNHPVLAQLMRLRGILDELERIPAAQGKPGEPNSERQLNGQN